MKALTVPGEPEYLGDVVAYVLAAAEMAQLDDRAAYRLRLAVDEIATNVVTHGFVEAGREGWLRITAVSTPTQLKIYLDDTAAPYDPTQCPHPANLNASPDDRHPGGLGIYLALGGVDNFRYERRNGWNRSTFIAHRKPVLVPAY
ncbi:MAG: ATP-binding protein [Anaerolineales bacterium]|nr:ATP-binding protein [Anaerolineales bacterium]